MEEILVEGAVAEVEVPRTKLAIVIITYNVSNLLSRQINLIRKYCKDSDYEIIVFDNSNKKDKIDDIKYLTTELGVELFKILSVESAGSESNVFACNVAYSLLKDKYEFFFYLDHDTFPLRDFSVLEILHGRAIAGVGQVKKKKYFQQTCLMWDNRTIDHDLINFSFSHELGLDSGGMLYKIIEKYTEGACVFFNEGYCQNPYYRTGFYNFYSVINDEMFMHFINASNWNPTPDNEARINGLINILDERTA